MKFSLRRGLLRPGGAQRESALHNQESAFSPRMGEGGAGPVLRIVENL
ncbi:MAG: hypothetical protein ACU826_04000 [Gammaproteobacteria bacterium]